MRDGGSSPVETAVRNWKLLPRRKFSEAATLQSRWDDMRKNLKYIAGEITNLFFPPICPACGEVMPEGGSLVCTRCRADIPLTFFWSQAENPMRERLWELQLPVENASSFFFFMTGSGFRGVIHSFKYRGSWRLAQQMGMWYGAEMAASDLYDDVDVVVPVPLHLRKRLKRGYNQAEYLAEGIAAALGRPMDRRSIVRRIYNKSQTKNDRHKRWENVAGIFAVRNPEVLRGKHILLVDDVLTTGATLVSCGQEILSRVPDVRLSVATLAVARSDLGKTKK